MRAPGTLTIGIDARAAAEVPAGRGRFVRELLRALAERPHGPHRYVLYARETWHDGALDERFRWQLLGAADPWWHLLAARHANRECDVFLSSNSYLTVWFLRIPGVPVVYDMTTFEASMRPNWRSTIIERATLGPAIRRASGVIAISQATADALAQRFPRARALTSVAPLGLAAALGAAGSGSEARENLSSLPSPGFVLAVGTLEPRKNLPRLVAAYGRLPASMQAQHPLVVVGANGWQTGETLSALRSLGSRSVQLGYVSDQALAELYRRCALFCYPSLGEGFGLPVLEAMFAGAPVLTSNLSSLPEVGGDAVEYADPSQVSSIAAGLERLLGSPERRAELRERGRGRAEQFTWAKTSELILAALDRAAQRGEPSHSCAT
jgi:glycosyltransferase involved in cell wall biosynthesis